MNEGCNLIYPKLVQCWYGQRRKLLITWVPLLDRAIPEICQKLCLHGLSLKWTIEKGCFQLVEDAQLSFHALKQAMASTLVLALPDFSKPVIMQMDTIGIGIGAVLLQFNHPIAYLSTVLSPKFQNPSTYIRALNAITSAVKKWRQCLLGSQFAI